MIEEKDTVFRLKKSLYGLKQAPRTWHVRLDMYLEKLGFIKGTVDSNLYLREIERGILVIVDVIIFGGDGEASEFFFDEIKKEFKMSMIC